MKVLFIGGNGNISWWCVQEALEHGYEVYEMNRGLTRTTRRAIQPNVKTIICDVRNSEDLKECLKGFYFDVVCDFICYNDSHAKTMIDAFSGKCGQYIVISSECVYRDRSGAIALNENSAKFDSEEISGYIQGKLLLEKEFHRAFYDIKFPLTIVRPGATYDNLVFTPLGRNDFTVPQMILDGYPYLMVGDGTNFHIPLHSEDFAKAFVQLIGNRNTIGEDYLITADQRVSWNDMADALFEALDIKERNVLHFQRDDVIRRLEIGDIALFDETLNSYNYSNVKIKMMAPDWKQMINYYDGIGRCIKWLREDGRRQRVNSELYNKLVLLLEDKCCQ